MGSGTAIEVAGGRVVRIRVSGALGHAEAGELERAFAPVLSARSPTLLDLRRCSRVSPEAAARILYLRGEARRRGARLRILVAEVAERDLERLGLAAVLEVGRELEEALRALVADPGSASRGRGDSA